MKRKLLRSTSQSIKTFSFSCFISLFLLVAVIALIFPVDLFASDVFIEKPKAKIISFSKEEEKILFKKFEDLNNNINLSYGTYLTKREQQIRLQMMKEKYPIDWYVKKFGGFNEYDNCDNPKYFKDYHCNHSKILHELTEEQIISVLLHYDDGQEYRSFDSMMSIVTAILFTGSLASYITWESENGRFYSLNYITYHELHDLIRNDLILNEYKKNIPIVIEEMFKYYDIIPND